MDLDHDGHGRDDAPVVHAREEVWKIVTQQDVQGLEDTFLVLLVEGGKRVRRSRTELTQIAPKLLAAFDAQKREAAAAASSHSRSRSRSASASTGPARQSKRGESDDASMSSDGGRGNKGAQRRRGERDRRRPATYSEADNSDESSEEEDKDESGEFEEEDEGDESSARGKRGGKKEKPLRQGTRVSSRDKGSRKVNYKLGGEDEEEEEEDDDDEMVLDDDESEQDEAEESEDELSIQDEGGKEIDVDLETNSDEEGASNEDEGQRKPVDENVHLNETRPQDMHNRLCANPNCDKPPGSEIIAAYERKLEAQKSKRAPTRTKANARQKQDPDFDDKFSPEEEFSMDKAKGAWIECENCVFAYHYTCLSATLQKNFRTKLESEHARSDRKHKKRVKVELDPYKVLSIRKCTLCEKPSGTHCCGCTKPGKQITEFEQEYFEEMKKSEQDVDMKDVSSASDQFRPGLMFRCQTCKRPAHYGCLDRVEFSDGETTWINHTLSYHRGGVCHDCHRYDVAWGVELDVILGWKEGPVDPSKPPRGEKVTDKKTGKEFVLPNAKDSLFPALYLVKWKGWSYRDLNWVEHSWLAARYQSRLSKFLTKGSTVSFEPTKEELGEEQDEVEPDAKEAAAAAQTEDDPVGPVPDADIEERIPAAWKVVDRVIDVVYTSPLSGKEIRIKDWRNRPADDRESVKHVKRAYMKWCGLAYDQSTEQEPPKEGDDAYDSFFKAYQAYVVASQREMRVPRLTPSEIGHLDAKRKGKSPVFVEQPETVQNGQLMDFQIQGLNFLLNHWWVKTGCILADEMGLGKTCQLICFLAYLNLVQKARPFLIVVPNSLVSNWLREFDKWAPQLRVVAYNGNAESRRIVEEFEMFAENGDLKTHVVVTTYEALKNQANVFARCTRWDCVVIDEGQALKSGEGNKLWGSLEKLRIGMKVLLTGTPLNNNLRELYNLLNFLDPERFYNVDELADQTKEMTKERVDAIREDLRPYMLRRTKDQVLNLPPLGEFVVPVSLTMLQRQLYRGILEKNSRAIQQIMKNTGKKSVKTTATTNTLMTLRKIVCHPYLHVPELDPGNSVPPAEAFRQLTDASAKLVLLERLLPKLREKGHKVLIFSQFKIVLNKLGPFLDGIGAKWLRLDGDTPQLDRQRDVDRFNDPNSPYSVFILSTRAGGVGLTLTAADVVIIFDQDFNPFQDMQAIARAHRIGQKNPVRVFRLVVKGTCEEKILAAGRKKQGLEHLIIQRIDAKDDETEDVAGALQYGAQAILETDDAEAEKTAQRYTDAEIDELLSKTAEPLSEAAKENAGAFATAQVWVSEKGGLSDVGQVGAEVEAEQDLQGFWDRIVAKEEALDKEKKENEQAQSGPRMRRAKKDVNYVVPMAIVPMTEAQKKKRRAARGGGTSGISDAVSSGDEFRYDPRKHRDSSSDEFVPRFEADDHPIVNGDRPQTRPKPDLSNQQPQASRVDEDAVAMDRLREKKLENRKRAIRPLIAAAKELNNQEVLEELGRALLTEDAVEQKTIITRATKILDETDRNVPRDRPAGDKRPVQAASQAPRSRDASATEMPTARAAPAIAPKRPSDTPSEVVQKRPKHSHVDAADKAAASSTKTSSHGGKSQAAAPMIRSDSKASSSEGVKRPSHVQTTLSFGQKPNSSSPVDKKPVSNGANGGAAGSTSTSAKTAKTAKETAKKAKNTETIVILDSDDDS